MLRRRKPIEERFWPKVVKRGPDDCWLWTAAAAPFGHGLISVNGSGTQTQAHRVSWQLANGPIPDGLLVLHKCDVPKCVNPAHLFLGTQGDNMRDMCTKGRNWQQKKTHCKNGHRFDEENTYRWKQTRRSCRVCNRAAQARVQERKAAHA